MDLFKLVLISLFNLRGERSRALIIILFDHLSPPISTILRLILGWWMETTALLINIVNHSKQPAPETEDREEEQPFHFILFHLVSFSSLLNQIFSGTSNEIIKTL